MQKRSSVKNFLVRPIAAALVLSLAYSQALFAADPRQMLLDAKHAFEEMDDTRRASTGSSAEQLVASQTQQQNIVDQQNALQDLQNLNFNLTTQNGDILNYVGNTLNQVTRPDGTTLINIQQDANGNITNANLKLVDGSIQVYQNGQVIGYQTPDGSQVIYADGQIQWVTSKDGVKTTYLHPNPNEIILDNSSYQTTYSSSGVLTKIVQKSNGQTTFFDASGVIQKITKPNGTTLDFTTTTLAAGAIKVVPVTPPSVNLFQEASGVVSAESENFSSNTPGPDHAWTKDASGFMVAGPDNGTNFNDSTGSPRLDYKVNFTHTGTYYLWVRGVATDGGSDSLHAGVDGVLTSAGTKITGFPSGTNYWISKNGSGVAVAFQITTAGEHTINFWVREDGFKLDKFILTQSSTFVPSGTSLAESVKSTGSPELLALFNAAPKEIIYDVNNKISQVLTQDNTRIYFENGLPKQAVDSQGKSTDFSFSQSSLSNVLGSQIVQNSVTSKYDSTGKLSEVSLTGLTIHYKSNSSAIDFIKKEDGTELHDLVFDNAGQITAAVITTPDGEERIYAAGKLVSLKKPDQSTILYSNDKPLKIITPQKLSYSFSYTPALIEAVLDTNGIQTPDSLAAVRMEYDQNFNLKKVTRQNQEVLNYLSDTKLRIDIPESASQLIEYVKDTQGNILSYTTTQGSAKTFYDANNQPIKAIISPTAENPHTLEVTYQYGKIRQITKDTVLTFVYTYSFNTNNEEITTIEDKEEKSVKTYKNSLLLNSITTDTSVLSTYTYNSSNQVTKVDTTRFGRLLHTYTYSYPTNQTVVSDEEGTVRTYDANKKLIFLEKENKKYAYTYSPSDDPAIIITQEALIEQKLSDGSVAHYENGSVSFIDRADGVKIANIILNSDRSIQSAEATLADGTKQVFDGSVILKETRPDGSIFEFQNGALAKVTTAPGEIFELSYISDNSGNITSVNILMGGVLYRYSIAGQLTCLGVNGNDYSYTGPAPAGDFLTQNKAIIQNVISGITASQAQALAQENQTILLKAQAQDRYNRKFSLSQNTGAFYTPPYEYSESFRQSHQDLPGNQTGWAFARWENNSSYFNTVYNVNQTSDKPHGVWFYTAASTTAPKVFVTMNQIVGYETIPYDNLYLQTGAGWEKAPKNIYWRGKVTTNGNLEYPYGYSTANDPEGTWPGLTQTLWFAIGTELRGVWMGPDGNSSTLGFVRSYANGQYSVTTGTNVYFGYYEDDLAIQNFNAQLAQIGQTKARLAQDKNSFQAALTVLNSKTSASVSMASRPFQNFQISGNVSSLQATAIASVFKADTVIASEYSSDGTLETQTKADQTVTLFENNKPSKVLDKSGVVLIQYTYDASGNIKTVYLKNARETLPQEVLKARKTIEGQRASQLETIAAQQNLAYQSIKTQYDSQRQALEAQLSELQNNFNSLSGVKVSGKSAKNQKGDALNQIGNAMDAARNGLINLETIQANAYAGLSAQVKQISDQIIADSQAALTALSAQEASLKKEILKQEASPVIYDYYRRILGRDPSQAEYDYWIQKMDYSSGENGAEASILLESSPVNPLTLAYKEVNSQVSVEAENPFANTAGTDDSWTKDSSGFMVAGPDNGGNINDSTGSPRLDYKVNFTHTGTYYLWVRGIATDDNSDSLHAGVDGVLTAAGTKVTNFYVKGANYWVNKNGNNVVVTFQITTPGDHTINFWMREDGFKLDKFILTQNASFVPSGASLAESDRVAPPPQPTSQKITQALTGFLNALPELAQRQAYVQHVKSAVTTLVNQYLAKSQADKEAYAASLGLASTDLINLSASDAQKILAWLNSRSLHFGQSAFLSLESLLDSKNLNYNREELAQKAIMTDILTGVISPLDDGDLVISMFALNKVAQGYGLNLSGANLTWEDLMNVIPAQAGIQTPRVIAHINGNHYVIITSMTATSVTYIDPGIGADKQNESATVTKEGFLKSWKGYADLEQSKLQTIANYQSKTLSAAQAKSVRGAFWGSLLGFIGSILTWVPGLNGVGIALTAISAAISVIEGDFISAISSIVTLGIGNLGGFFQTAFDGVVKAMGPIGQGLSAVGQFFGNIYQSVTGFFGGISKTLGTFLSGSLGVQSAVASKIAETALSVGINFGVSKGLSTIGVNPEIAGFFGNLAAGAVIGSISPLDKTESGVQLTRAQVIKDSIQKTVTITSIGNLGLQLGLDTSFTNIVGLSVAAIQGIQIQNPTTTLQQAFAQVKPQLAGSLAKYGIDKLGTSVGLSTALSSLAGIPISNALASSFEQTKWTGTINPAEQNNAAVNTKVYYDEAQHREVFMPASGTPERSWWDGVIGFVKNNLVNMAKAAINAYYASQNKPAASSSTITTPDAPLPNGAVALDYQDLSGSTKKGYKITSDQNNYVIYDRLTGFAVKRVAGGVIEEGVFNYEIIKRIDGSYSLDLKVPTHLSQGNVTYSTSQGGRAVFKIVEDSVREIKIEVNSPDIILDPGTVKDASNKVINGVVQIISLGLRLVITNGQVSKDSPGNNLSSQELNKTLKRSYVFGNGFENERRPENTPDPLVEKYVLNLEAEKIINPAKKLMFYLYEMTKIVGNAVDWLSDFEPVLLHILEGPTANLIDFLNNLISLESIPASMRPYIQGLKDYLGQNWGITNNLVREVIDELDQKGPIEDGIAFVHSGATAPLLKALQIKPYDIQTVLIYEGPHPDYTEQILNPNLERIIHVRGTGSPAEGDSYVPFLGKAQFGGVTNINIEIKGAFHNDFSYNPNDYADRTNWNEQKAQRQKVNRRVNLFMRDLYRAVLSDQTEPGDLNAFFENLISQQAARYENGIFKIDPEKLRDVV